MKRIAALAFFIFGGINAANSTELMSTADIMEAGSWRLSVYGKQVESDPVFDISGTSAITVPTMGGGTTIFSNSNVEVEMEKEMETAVAMLTFRPRDGLHYRLKVGQVRDLSLKFSSGTLTNEFLAQSDGIEWGFGVRWNGSQNTFVSSAVSFDLSYTQLIVDIDGFRSGNTFSNVNDRYEEEEFQGAVTVSHRFKWIEPYGGLKLAHVRSKLKDRTTKQKISGSNETFSPFVGLAVSAFKNEIFTVEASFVDEQMISAGIQIGFN